jgi:hypothetical protein
MPTCEHCQYYFSSKTSAHKSLGKYVPDLNGYIKHRCDALPEIVIRRTDVIERIVYDSMGFFTEKWHIEKVDFDYPQGCSLYAP